MASNYRLISGDEVEVNRQLTIMSAQNRAGSEVEKPILMSTTTAVLPQGGTRVTLYVIVESS